MGNIEEIDLSMKSGYRSFSSDFKDEVKALFSILLNEDALPVAFHCTAGKDRTGMLTALFLLGLDVSEDDVISDYMETNNRIDTKNISQEINEYFRSNSSTQLPYSEKSIQTLEMLFAVNKSWIEIFILGIEESFGSIESYLKDEIKLDIEGLKKIYIIG
jgi:protein-tyrosine phosphatase